MAYLKDTEGEDLTITDYNGRKTWEVYVSPDYKGEFEYTGISILFSIPEYLTDGENEYQSCGLLIADLDNVFTEYLDDVDTNDNGLSLDTFIGLLSKYTEKATAKKIELDNTHGRQ